MKTTAAMFWLAVTVLAGVVPAWAQAPRKDVFWARKATGPITLNGILSEPEWAQAESMTVRWAQNAGIPGSGWKVEGGLLPTDPTNATLKLLVVGNQLYLGARIRDVSIGGSKDFNRHDGLLMSLKDHSSTAAPKPPAEYFYAWWYPTTTDPQPVGQSPAFIGKWATWPPGSARTPTEIANWDAVTVVHGTSNSDALPLDTDYVVEMRFDLTAMGYDVTRPEGDVVEWNVSIYDCDYLWPIVAQKLAYNRVWWQSPWGNDAWYDEVHVFARPSVTTSSGALPVVGPEFVVHDGLGFVKPVVDGNINDPIWGSVTGFDIRYGDDALRQTYGGVGPHRAGQFQATINGGQAAVLDPGDATVKMVFKDHTLYFAFDVRDQVVQYHANFDRWDGFLVSINDRKALSPDNTLIGRRLSFQVGQNGAAVPQDYLATMVANGDAQVALQMNAGSAPDTVGTPDTGWKGEMAIDLAKIGYPTSLGDNILFIGITLLDGDSFLPITDSYGTRAWWFREYEGNCCPAWAHLAVTPISEAGDPSGDQTDGFLLLGASPNPSLRSVIRYALPKASQADLEVYDVSGRQVERRRLGVQSPGAQEAAFDGSGYAAGMYFYRIQLSDPVSGAPRRTLSGRIVVVK